VEREDEVLTSRAKRKREARLDRTVNQIEKKGGGNKKRYSVTGSTRREIQLLNL